MQHRQGNPFRSALSPADRDVLDAIRARSIARFGYDAFRMEDGGGSGSGDGGGQGGDGGQGAGDQGGAGQGTGQQGGGDQGQQQAAADAQKVEELPDWAQKLIRDTRDEAAKNRTGKSAAEERQQAIMVAVAKAAGLKIDGDDQPTPEQLAEQLNASQTQAREAAVQLAVYREAAKHQGDPDALLDSRAFLAKVSDLDPTAGDFASKVETAIKDAVNSNPKLKTVQAAGSSSADHGAGGSGEQQARTPKSLADAVGGHYGT
ncbi:hypothetical protein [Nocardioides zeae]